MSETKTAAETPRVVEEDRDFRGVLLTLVGKNVTIVNPESFEAAPMVGFHLKEGFYKGKITAVGNDYIVFLTMVTLSKKEGGQQPVQQFIPAARLKRVSVMKSGIFLHI
jgi:hypothetical protein